MARIFSPLGSQQASGSLADLLTFSNSKGRAYVKRKSAPTGDPTISQVSARLAFQMLNAAWPAELSDADKQTWAALAADLNITLPNAFTKQNLTEALAGRPMIKDATNTGNSTNPTTTVNILTVSGPNEITFTYQIGAVNNGWHSILRAAPVGALQKNDDPVIHIWDDQITTPQTFIVGNLPTGTYRFRRRAVKRTTTPVGAATNYTGIIP